MDPSKFTEIPPPEWETPILDGELEAVRFEHAATMPGSTRQKQLFARIRALERKREEEKTAMRADLNRRYGNKKSIETLRRAYEEDPGDGSLAVQLAVELNRLGRHVEPELELAALWHHFRTDPTNGNHARALLGRLTRDGREVPTELLEALLNYYLSRDTLIPNSIAGCIRPLVNLGVSPQMARIWARLETWSLDPEQTQAAQNEMVALEPIYRAIIGDAGTS